MALSTEISKFSPDDAPKLGRICAATGKPFSPGDKVYSVLYEEDGEIKRRDLCASAWRSNPRPKDALAWWSSRVSVDPEKDQKVKLAPNDALTALFVSLADKPGKEALRYTLALLLARRRVLRFDYDENASMGSDPDAIYVYSPRNEAGYLVPIVQMTQAQIAEVQEKLVALVEAPTAALENEEKAEETTKKTIEETPREIVRDDEDEAQKLDRARRLQAVREAFDESEIAEEAQAAFKAAMEQG